MWSSHGHHRWPMRIGPIKFTLSVDDIMLSPPPELTLKGIIYIIWRQILYHYTKWNVMSKGSSNVNKFLSYVMKSFFYWGHIPFPGIKNERWQRKCWGRVRAWSFFGVRRGAQRKEGGLWVRVRGSERGTDSVPTLLITVSLETERGLPLALGNLPGLVAEREQRWRQGGGRER